MNRRKVRRATSVPSECAITSRPGGVRVVSPIGEMLFTLQQAEAFAACFASALDEARKPAQPCDCEECHTLGLAPTVLS